MFLTYQESHANIRLTHESRGKGGSMCGRYNIDFEANRELKKILEHLNQKYPGNQVKKNEVFPTNTAAILTAGQEEAEPELSIWGFPMYNKKGVMINARAETAFEKKTFRESLMNRRCAVLTTGFFEWDQEKKKYFFTEPGDEILYLGGIFNFYNQENRFVILTTEANESMEGIHHRMPVILKKDRLHDWLFDPAATNDLLHERQAILKPQLVSA